MLFRLSFRKASRQRIVCTVQNLGWIVPTIQELYNCLGSAPRCAIHFWVVGTIQRAGMNSANYKNTDSGHYPKCHVRYWGTIHVWIVGTIYSVDLGLPMRQGLVGLKD